MTSALTKAVGAMAIIGCLVSAQAQVTVQVDSTKPWGGFMNVFSLVGSGATASAGGYQFGSGWGLPDLRGFFTGTSTLTLTPCSNVFNPADAYWANPDGSGNKWMDASFYVDVGNSFAGQAVTFSGSVISNTLVAPYTCVATIKEFAPGYAYIGQDNFTLVAGQPFTVTRTIGVGNIAQYGFETTGPDVSPLNFAAAGKVVIAVSNPPILLTPIVSQSGVQGQTVHFTATATGAAPLAYQWYFVTNGVTNTLVNNSHYSGVTTTNLGITNISSSDVGTYRVVVSNPGASATSAALLTVIPLAQAQTNMLIDPSFEDAALSYDSTAGWYPFNGAVQASTNDYYYLSATHVVTFDGANAVQIYPGGDYNGLFQDRPVTPGQVYTASGKFYVSSADPLGAPNVCYLEVQFRDAGNAVLRQYSSHQVDSTDALDTWLTLVPTNVFAGDFSTSLGTSSYMVAPAGSAYARYQFTYHATGGYGSVYVDAASLALKEPLTTASITNGSVKIKFPTLYGPTYKVLYKTNLNDATWSTLTTVTGDATTKTVSDTVGPSRRFYTVNTQ